MHSSVKRCLILAILAALLAQAPGCSSYQPTKNVMKTTRELWYEYISPPAHIDYDDKASVEPLGQAFVDGMMGIDIELARLERLMSNADRTPTRGWVTQFFAEVPWVEGLAGLKSDGVQVGQETAPGKVQVSLDFVPLLYEPPKQALRALRGDVQPSAQGPMVVLGAPLYDGIDFLGVVATYFRMSSLMDRSKKPDEMVILTPHALLWSPFDYAATPLAGVDWTTAVAKASHGTASSEAGSFAWQVRWLGNLPIVFALVEKGSFPKSSGSLAGSEKFFPAREKLPVPPVKPRTTTNLLGEEIVPPAPGQEAQGPRSGGSSATEIEPGSSESILRPEEAAGAQRQGRVRERALEGEDVPFEPQPRPRQIRRPRMPIVIPDMDEEPAEPMPEYKAPSPFGPRGAQPAQPAQPESAPAEEPAAPAAEPAAEPASPMPPATLPGGRPSPFGPRPSVQEEAAPSGPVLPGGRPSPFGPRAAQPAQPESAPAAEPAAPAAEPAAPASPEPSATLPGGRPSPFGPRGGQ